MTKEQERKLMYDEIYRNFKNGKMNRKEIIAKYNICYETCNKIILRYKQAEDYMQSEKFKKDFEYFYYYKYLLDDNLINDEYFWYLYKNGHNLYNMLKLECYHFTDLHSPNILYTFDELRSMIINGKLIDLILLSRWGGCKIGYKHIKFLIDFLDCKGRIPKKVTLNNAEKKREKYSFNSTKCINFINNLDPSYFIEGEKNNV